MNREELEKMFDNQNFYEISYRSWEWYVDFEQIKSYIFNTIIVEVLKSVIPELQNTQTNDYQINDMRYWSNDCIHYIKQKAKEQFWIDL